MKKILKYLTSPVVTVISWVVFLLSPVSGLIRLQVLTNPNLQIFHVSGLSTLLFYSPFIISAFVFVIMIFWFREFARGSLTDWHQKIFTFISILTVLFLLTSQYLINKEYTNYPNYLYFHYGITVFHLQLMSFVAALQVMIFFAFYVYRLTYKPTKKLLKQSLLYTDSKTLSFENLSFLISVIGLLSLFILSGSTALEWPMLSRGLSEGYEGKVGVDYKYIQLISDHTPNDVIVIHPPQGNIWPAIGNQPVLRYFIYPRTLVSGALVTSQDFTKQINEAYFVVIDPKGDREWPIINISKKTVTFDENNPIKYKKLIVFFENEVSRVYKIDF